MALAYDLSGLKQSLFPSWRFRRCRTVHRIASMDSAKSLRMVPASALAGLVAPMISRYLAPRVAFQHLHEMGPSHEFTRSL